ncbi:hypothetical protein QZH41_018193 [Actinostola sp. cb2023]|nr:hypothetical protein QZH41_018193 [Actinostola sp. cb2023]
MKRMPLQALGHAENARDVLVAADAMFYQERQHYERKDVIPVIELTYLVMGQAHLMLKQYWAIKLGKAGFALECLEKALETAQDEYGSRSAQLIHIYQNIGQAEMHQGLGVTSRERALDAYLQAHGIAQQKAPSAKSFSSSEEKLRERPRFTQVVGHSKPVGSTAIIID